MAAAGSGSGFRWEDMGDLEKGRPNLGPRVPVLVYRLLQYTWRDVMRRELGGQKTDEIMVEAGRLAGSQFCRQLLDRSLDFAGFVSQLQRLLRELSIGILRIEKSDPARMHFTLTVAEDLDCSGLPFADEVVCRYDEGFLAGIFESWTGRPFTAREVDCWASGDRICRFEVRATGGSP
jgi:predicted hydrocarbon binding protein